MNHLTRSERKLQNSLIVVPWKDDEEYVQLRDGLFSENEECVRGSMNKINVWLSLGNNCSIQHVMEYTVLLLESIEFERNCAKQYNTSGNDVSTDKIIRQNYCIVLIRFINGLLDPLQNAAYAIPLMKLCDRIGIPKYIVEIRHQATHERILPSLEILNFAVQKCLKWVQDNYWDIESIEIEHDSEGEDNDGGTEKENIALQNELLLEKKEKEMGKEMIAYFHKNIDYFKNNRGYFMKNVMRSGFETANEDSLAKKKRLEIMRYTQDLKTRWKVWKYKEIFVKNVKRAKKYEYRDDQDNDNDEYDGFPLFLQMLLNKCDNFEYYYIKSLNLNVLEDRIAKDDFVLLEQIVKYMDMNKFLQNFHTLWEPIIMENSRVLNVLRKAVEVKVNKKKLKNSEPFNQMVKALERSTTSEEDVVKRKDSMVIIGEDKAAEPQAELETDTITPPKKRSLDTLDDILNDITTLKKVCKNESSVAGTTPQRKVALYSFEKPKNWEFKPFGVL